MKGLAGGYIIVTQPLLHVWVGLMMRHNFFFFFFFFYCVLIAIAIQYHHHTLFRKQPTRQTTTSTFINKSIISQKLVFVTDPFFFPPRYHPIPME